MDGASLLLATLEPLSTALHPRALCRLSCSSRALRDALYSSDDCWITAATTFGLPVRSIHRHLIALLFIHMCNIQFSSQSTVRDRLACSLFCRTKGAWCEETKFGAVIENFAVAKLALGSGIPKSTRVAAVSSLVALTKSCTLEFVVRDSDALITSGSNLWLGVMYNRRHLGESLDRPCTAACALAGYETASAEQKNVPFTQSIAERFGAHSVWAMSALGSNGAVWSDGEVNKLTPFRFGGNSAEVVVQMHLDLIKNTLSYTMPFGTTSRPVAAGTLLAVRRLVPRATTSGHPPRLYAVAQLTDVHRPVASRSEASVTVEWRAVRDLL